MIPVKCLHTQYLVECRLPKPRKVFKGKKVFLVFEKDPKTKLINIGNFSMRNACAMRRRCHRFFPPQFASILLTGPWRARDSWRVLPLVPTRIWLLHWHTRYAHEADFLLVKRRRTDNPSILNTVGLIERYYYLSARRAILLQPTIKKLPQIR